MHGTGNILIVYVGTFALVATIYCIDTVNTHFPLYVSL
jgi:hypothetical protein